MAELLLMIYMIPVLIVFSLLISLIFSIFGYEKHSSKDCYN